MIDISIAVRSIQHFLYCPHRWGLLEIDCAWSENIFVTKANIIHNRVHNPDTSYSTYGKRTCTSVSVFNDLPQYNLYGVTDCIEINNSDSKDLCIVEYKPTKPKNSDYNFEDLMQVFAQKICVDYVFKCDCDAVLYYADVKKRITLPLKENFNEYDEILIHTLTKMRELLVSGEIPPIKKSQRCNGCSMKDICIPKSVSVKNKKNVKENIYEVLKEEL